MFCLPVCARATLIALSTASEPELAKKKRVSWEGQIFSRRSSSAACTPGFQSSALPRVALQQNVRSLPRGLTIGGVAGKMFCCGWMTRAAWSWMALTTLGWLCPVDTTPMPAGTQRLHSG